MVSTNKAVLAPPTQNERRPVLTSAQDTLAWSQELLIPVLRAQVERLPMSMRRVVQYHFGWCDRNGVPTSGTNTGKAIRPALTLLSAMAVGGTAVQAVRAAAAVELVHNFSLLHDDVMDRDPIRRHRPTAWTVFGTSDALLAGDALLSLSSRCLAPHGEAAVDLLNETVIRLCEGQSADLGFEVRDEVGLADCWAMVRGKTASLLGCACHLGALVAGASEVRALALREFGEHLGLAFQLVDDVLGIWGDPKITGKPVHADLSARKKSLPVVAALSLNVPAARRLRDLYLRSEPLDEMQLREAALLVEEAGGRSWAQRKAEEQIDLAMQCLTDADCAPDPASRMRGIAQLITTRHC